MVCFILNVIVNLSDISADPVITPEMFAQSVVEDYNLPSSTQVIITKAIQEQLSDFKAHMPDGMDDIVEGNVELMKPEFNEDDRIWWEGWKKRLRDENGFVRRKKRKLGFDPSYTAVDEEIRVAPVVEDDVDPDENSTDEMRILIKVAFTFLLLQ
jgi:SWI/SNF-related matrix-associated actin-dependent regulator of chromatin subfamily B protein 1